MKTTQCPIPIDRLADHVPEIEQAQEWASFQSEYGVSQHEWLQNNEQNAQNMLNRWWNQLPIDIQQEWIVRYRSEIAEQIVSLKKQLEWLDKQILT